MIKIQDSKFKIQNLLLYLLLVACHLSLATVVFASGGEAGHTPLWKEYMWKILNFGVLFFILYKFGKAPLQSFLKQRTELIEKGIKDAREAKELAQKALAEVEERLRMKGSEIEDIISSARQSGEKEKARLIEEGERMKAKILEQARVNIEYELKGAKESIKAEAVEIAMELAEKKLKDKLGRGEQEMLLEESIMKIEGRK